MKKNIILIFSLLSTVLTYAQDIDTESTPATADVPTVVSTNDNAQQTEVKKTFGYLSYNKVIMSMPEYKQAQSSLEQLKVYYDQEMERAEEEFSKKFSEYIDGYKSFPENIMLKRQKELQQLMEQSLDFKKEAESLLNKSEQELMEPIHSRLKDAINSIGKERKYNYILNTDGNNYPFINTENGQGEDITDAVIKLVQ